MYNIMYEMSHQSRFDARYWMLGAGALGRPRGMVWGGRRVQDGEHMYTCGGFISIFGKTNKIKKKKKNMGSNPNLRCTDSSWHLKDDKQAGCKDLGKV